MALEVFFRTSDPFEAQMLVQRLRAAGIDVVLHGGAQASLIGVGQHIIEQQLLVPEEQLDDAIAFIDARPVLDSTIASGEDLGDSVCAVHEESAVATCSRCGSFLCAKCGSLGAPPLCESCVVRPEAPVVRARWARTLASAYVYLYAGGVVIVLAITLLLFLRRSFG